MSICIVTICYYNFFVFARGTLVRNHEGILLNKHIARQTSSHLKQYKNLIKGQIFQSDLLLLQLRSLYEFSLREDLELQFENVQCLQMHPNDTIVRNSTICYGIFGIFAQNQEMEKLNKLVTTQLLMLQMDNIYFTSTSEEQYFAYWPGQYLKDSFIPHNRPWYRDNRVSNETHVIKYSSPYLSVLGGIQVAKSINLGSRAIGVVDTDISIFQLVNNYQFMELQVIDNSGMYYFANEYEEGYENILYFQNTSITGFNQLDLEELLNLKYGKPYNNSCPILIHHSVCRRCEENMDHNFFLTNITYPNLIVILRVDSQEFKNILQNLFVIFDSFAIMVMNNIFMIFGFMLLLIVIILLSSIYIIQKPIDQILQLSIQYIKGTKKLQSNLYSLTKQSVSNTIRNLQDAYFNLVNLQSTQSKFYSEKGKIELIEYPKHNMWLHIECQDQIQDFRQPFMINCVFRFIIKEIFKKNSPI